MWEGDILCDTCHSLWLNCYEKNISFLNVKDEFDLPILTPQEADDDDAEPDVYRFTGCNEEFPCKFCIEKKKVEYS